jgi:hypothetical protein
LWNLKNDTLFKNLLKKLLVDKEYYNINEFCDANFKITDSDILKYVSKKDLIRYILNILRIIRLLYCTFVHIMFVSYYIYV